MSLTDDARYLFVRLCLRKADRWLKLADLKYQRELGDGIRAAMEQLCQDNTTTPSPPKPSEAIEQKKNFVDLTLEEEDVKPKLEDLMTADLERNLLGLASTEKPDYSRFAMCERHADARDLLECLTVDELRDVAKTMKLKAHSLQVRVSSHPSELQR